MLLRTSQLLRAQRLSLKRLKIATKRVAMGGQQNVYNSFHDSYILSFFRLVSRPSIPLIPFARYKMVNKVKINKILMLAEIDVGISEPSCSSVSSSWRIGSRYIHSYTRRWQG